MGAHFTKEQRALAHRLRAEGGTLREIAPNRSATMDRRTCTSCFRAPGFATGARTSGCRGRAGSPPVPRR